MDGSAMKSDVQSGLVSYYARAFPGREGIRISELVPISEGWESDMYAFTLESGPEGARQREELVLRLYSGEDAGRLELYDEAGTPILVFGPEESALIATIEAEPSRFTGGTVNVRFTLTNTSSEGLFALKWFTPLEGLAGDIFQITRDGVELPHVGKLVKRGAMTSEDYVWLDAGGSISAEVDLAEGYDFSQAGQYTLQFRSPRLSHTTKTSAEQATSLDELTMIQIPSNPVDVTIE